MTPGLKKKKTVERISAVECCSRIAPVCLCVVLYLKKARKALAFNCCAVPISKADVLCRCFVYEVWRTCHNIYTYIHACMKRMRGSAFSCFLVPSRRIAEEEKKKLKQTGPSVSESVRAHVRFFVESLFFRPLRPLNLEEKLFVHYIV